jgi:hypothetical protein
MNKKFYLYSSVVISVAFVLVAFVKPVQSLALDVLSIFRVNDVKTIEISITDIQEGMQKAAVLKEDLKGQKFEHKSPFKIISEPKHEVKSLKNAKEFKAFKLRLPRELESEKPEISAIDASEMQFTIDVNAANEILKAVKSQKLLSDKLNNVKLTLKTSAAAIAKYEEVLFFSSQNSYLDAPESAKQDLRNVILDSGLIPTNLRSQLAEIDVNSSDIYLPVLVGFGREVDLGGKNGYIYTLSDLKSLTGNLPEGMGTSEKHPKVTKDSKLPAVHTVKADDMTQKFIQKYGEAKFTAMKEAFKKSSEEMPNMDQASVLIWTKDGNLYCLIGNKTDKELSEIAKSVR